VLPELRASEPLVIALQEQLAHPLQRLGLPPRFCGGIDFLFDGEWRQIGSR
jgi:hypothetical protein